jgi:hypothetical protein
MEDLGRISKIPYVINIPYHTTSPRKSTSDIPSTSFQNADYTTNIPKPVYTDLEQPSPPTFPTFSAVTENIQNKLNVLTSEKHFVMNKTLLRRDFYGDHNIENDIDFFNISANREMISKNNFMLTLRPIKYKFYSLIGLNFIMHQNNILQIHLHPLNMHVYI